MTAPRVEAPGRRAQLVGVILSAGFLVALVWWATRQPRPQLPAGGDGLALVAGSMTAYAMATLARGERWLWLMRHGRARPSRADAYALTAVGYMGNNVLPARAGDAMRVYLQAPRAATGMRNVIGTLVAERVLDVVVLLTLFAVLAYGLLRGIESPDAEPLALVLMGGIAVAGVAATLLYSLRDREPVRRALTFVAPMVAATRALRGAHGARMLGLTLAIWMLEAVTYLAAARSVELAMSPIEALYVVALASVFVLIPSGPGYAGTLDAAVVFGARAIGAGGGLAVSFLLILRFVLVVPITLAGAALVFARYGGWRAARRGAPEGG